MLKDSNEQREGSEGNKKGKKGTQLDKYARK